MVAVRIKIQASFKNPLALSAFWFISYFTYNRGSVFLSSCLNVLNSWWLHVVAVPYMYFLTLPVCLGSVSKFLLASLCLLLPPVYCFVLPWSSVRASLFSQAGVSVCCGVPLTSSLSKVKSALPKSRIYALLLFSLTLLRPLTSSVCGPCSQDCHWASRPRPALPGFWTADPAVYQHWLAFPGPASKAYPYCSVILQLSLK